ncbi:immunoglobulin-like domain-containing protein, partial [Paenibacillus sp. TAF58]
GEHGATIEWESSMPSLISNEGKFLTRPANNTMFMLNATVKRGDVSHTKSIPVIVKGMNIATIELHGMSTVNGLPYTNDTWTNQNVTVSVYASVYAPSTSAVIEFSMDGDIDSGYKPYESNSKKEISKQGENQLFFRGTDNLGNQAKLPLTVRIDKVIPAIALIGESRTSIAKGTRSCSYG